MWAGMGRLVSHIFCYYNITSRDLAANGISAEPCAYEWGKFFKNDRNF